MDAPDKICVAPHQIFDYDLEIQEVGHNGAEEYIRKNALIEWADSWLVFKRSGIVLDDGFSYALEELIKKLNEM